MPASPPPPTRLLAAALKLAAVCNVPSARSSASNNCVGRQAGKSCLCLPCPPRVQDPEHDTAVFNSDGVAPLHLAARGGHMGAVSFLLQKGCFVDMQDWEVRPPAGRIPTT